MIVHIWKIAAHCCFMASVEWIRQIFLTFDCCGHFNVYITCSMITYDCDSIQVHVGINACTYHVTNCVDMRSLSYI